MLTDASAAASRGWPRAWRAEEPVDNDCFEPIDGKVAVTLTVKDDGLIVDFAGTAAAQGLQEQLDRQLDLGGVHGAVVVLRARPSQERRRLPRRRNPPARGHRW